MNIRFGIVAVLGVFFTSYLLQAGDLTGKKVLYIDSYSEGYPWSDGITNGIKNILTPTGATLEIVRLDTKKNPSDVAKKAAAAKAVAKITEFKPDIVIASDDNASNYVIVPNYKNVSMPVVFCGINWDASSYGFPCNNVTGMLEVAPIKQLVGYLEKYAKGKKIAYLASDCETERKEVTNINKKFGLDVQPTFVTTFGDWKKQFTMIQGSSDMLILGVYEGIKEWDNAAAIAYASSETRIPAGAVYDYLGDFVLLCLTKIPDEQGEYAAFVATEILKGKPLKSFPVTDNKKSDIIVNMKMAKKLNVVMDVDLLTSAKVIK